MGQAKRRGSFEERKATAFDIDAIAADIVGSVPPDVSYDGKTIEAVEQWFDKDPDAPMVLLSYPPGAELGGIHPTVASINAHRVEFELRKRGIDESHPKWEVTFHATFALCKTTLRRLAESIN